jgi:ABC-type transport system involved in cytochrome c biogenesis ATPase subunit
MEEQFRPIPSIAGGDLKQLTAIRERELARARTRHLIREEAWELKIWYEVQVTLSPWQRVSDFAMIEAAIAARMEAFLDLAVQLLAVEQQDRAALARIWQSI